MLSMNSYGCWLSKAATKLIKNHYLITIHTQICKYINILKVFAAIFIIICDINTILSWLFIYEAAVGFSKTADGFSKAAVGCM